ncbi:unknown [Prevotella sp. CAG:924]|nr:unknown [Prevotella sp. CAG:924]
MGKYQIGYCSRLTSQGGLAMEAMRKGRSMVVFRADCSDQFFLRMSMS